MSTKLNLRFAHFPSRAPIMLELQVDPNTTVGQLRALVEEKLATEDHCLVRFFSKWYFEAQVGTTRRPFELTDADGESVLSAVGIEDECELYLEGPVIEAEHDGVGKALALLHADGLRSKAETQSEIRALYAAHQAQMEALAHLTSHCHDMQTQQSAKVQELLSIIQEQKRTIEKQGSQLANLESELIKFQAGSLLNGEPNMPLKALWEVLSDKDSSVELAMAIVMNTRCGINLTTTLADGEMMSESEFVLNKEKGGLTPLIMAALAGRVDVMKALLAAGADRDAGEATLGATALHVAAYVNDTLAIELLVSYGADVNCQRRYLNDYYITPLHEAAYNCNLEAIEVLLAKGADTTKMDKFEGRAGDTPLRYFDARKNAFRDKPKEVLDRVTKLLSPQ